MCALDFYVHESCQRHGYGKVVFETMLRAEGLLPAQMAYDRPSPKLIGFLAKHYGLTEYMPQNNNYVVFDEYFLTPKARSGKDSLRSRSGPPPVREATSTPAPLWRPEAASTPAAPRLPQNSQPGLYQPLQQSQFMQQSQPIQQSPFMQQSQPLQQSPFMQQSQPLQQSLQQDLSMHPLQQQQQQFFLQQPTPQHQQQLQPQFLGSQQHSVMHQQNRQPRAQMSGKVVAPWATSDGYGQEAIYTAKYPPRLPTGSTSSQLSDAFAAAGRPSRAPSRGGRSSSVPGQGRFGSGEEERAGSSKRFASPLSHAGHLLLG